MKSTFRNLLTLSCLVLVTSAAATRGMADTVAYTTSLPETDLAAYGLSGVEFTLTQSINITQLGFTGLSIGGGDTPHVTLWNANAGFGALTQIYDTGNIVSSVASTGPNTSTGAPSFVSVGTPITLTAGSTYLITAPAYWASTFDSGSVSTLDNTVFSSSSFVTGGGWNGWDNSGYTFSSLAPSNPAQTPTVANFQYTVAAVPEPSTYLMLGLGLAALMITVRRRVAGTVL